MNPADVTIAALLAACAILAWWRRGAPGAREMAAACAALCCVHVALCALAVALPHGSGPYLSARAWWQRAEMALRAGWPGVVACGVVAAVRRMR